jgi:hypothetical protein
MNCDPRAKLLLQRWQYVVHKTEDLQFSNEVLQYCFSALGDVLLLTAEGNVMGVVRWNNSENVVSRYRINDDL